MNIKIENTTLAKEEAENLIRCENEFTSCIGTLRYIYQNFNNIWQGNAQDVESSKKALKDCIDYYETKISPALNKLGNGILAYSTATEELANRGYDPNTNPSQWVNFDKEDAPAEYNNDNSDSGNGYDNGDGHTVDLPQDVDTSTTTYMNWNQKWHPGSDQKHFMDQAFADGTVTCDKDGFYLVNDGTTDRYVVAVTSKYGNVGDYIDVYQADGTVLKCVIGDAKSYYDANSGEYGHMFGGTINVLEFMTDWTGSHSNPGSVRSSLDQNIIKVVNTGETYDFPPADYYNY